jgi:hypothetical protein
MEGGATGEAGALGLGAPPTAVEQAARTEVTRPMAISRGRTGVRDIVMEPPE